MSAAVVSLVAVVVWMMLAASSFMIDLRVFQDAGVAWSRRLPLYSEDFATSTGLRFIYPPFAAVLFAPLGALTPAAGQLLWTAASIGCLWWCLKVLSARCGIARPGLAAGCLLGLASVLEPVRSNLGFGQINIFLMTLVIADLTGATPRRLRGVGIGVAAAIKITPAAFVLVFLLARDGKSVARAGAAFAAATVIGAVAAPQASLYFWATEFFITDRAGAHAFHRNQAITGALARAGLDGVAKDLVWLLLSTAVIVAGVYAISRFQRAGDVVPTIGVATLVTLLIAPIAVTHHWVYCIALLPVLIAPRYRRWRPMVAVAAAAFILGPHTVLTAPAINSSEGAIPLTIVGNAQLLTAVMLLICAVVAARRCDPTPPAPTSLVLTDQHRQQHEGGPAPQLPLSSLVGEHR